MTQLKTPILLFVIAGLLMVDGLLAQEIGLQLYSLRNELKKDVPGTLAKVKEWGITKVEAGNGGTHGYTLEAYKALLEKYNLEMVSVSATYEELEKSPEKVLQRAKDFEARYVVCFWIPHKDTVFTIKEARDALEVFNTAGEKLKAQGVTLTYHPHGYEFRRYEDGTLMEHMIKNAEFFDFEMDVFWFAHPGEDPVNWLRRYPSKFKLMHLKDCRKGVEGNQNGRSDVEDNVPLGQGQIDIAAVVREAHKLGLEYLFIEDESSRSVSQIPQSLDYLNNLKIE